MILVIYLSLILEMILIKKQFPKLIYKRDQRTCERAFYLSFCFDIFVSKASSKVIRLKGKY